MKGASVRPTKPNRWNSPASDVSLSPGLALVVWGKGCDLGFWSGVRVHWEMSAKFKRNTIKFKRKTCKSYVSGSNESNPSYQEHLNTRKKRQCCTCHVVQQDRWCGDECEVSRTVSPWPCHQTLKKSTCKNQDGRGRRRIKDGATRGSRGGTYSGEMAHTQAGVITVVWGILLVRRPTRDRWSHIHLNCCHRAWLGLTGLAGVLWLGYH